MKVLVMIRAKTQKDLDYIKDECKGTVWENQTTDVAGNFVLHGVADTEHIGIKPEGKSQVVLTFEG